MRNHLRGTSQGIVAEPHNRFDMLVADSELLELLGPSRHIAQVVFQVQARRAIADQTFDLSRPLLECYEPHLPPCRKCEKLRQRSLPGQKDVSPCYQSKPLTPQW